MLLSHAEMIYRRILEAGLIKVMCGRYFERQSVWLSTRVQHNRPHLIVKMMFDRINRRNLWRVPAEDHYLQCTSKLVRVIRSVYDNCVSKVKTRSIERTPFQVKTGVRQEIDKCIRDVGVGEHGEETLMYADDVAVLLENRDNLQDVANKWWTGMKENGMAINTKKNKTGMVMI